jgi:hypothetical protein
VSPLAIDQEMIDLVHAQLKNRTKRDHIPFDELRRDVLATAALTKWRGMQSVKCQVFSPYSLRRQNPSCPWHCQEIVLCHRCTGFCMDYIHATAIVSKIRLLILTY